jgi:hypothetical protein
MKITPKPFEVPPQPTALPTLPEQASLGAKSKGFAQALENETQISRNPVTPKPLQAPAAIVNLSPAAIAATEDDSLVKKFSDDPTVRYAFDPLPPDWIRKKSADDSIVRYAFDPLPPIWLRNKTIPDPLPLVEAPGKVIPAPLSYETNPGAGVNPELKPSQSLQEVNEKSQSTPAFEARKALADHPELADIPFGQVVSLLARGLPLPTDPPPSDGGGEDNPPTEVVGGIPADSAASKQVVENVPAPLLAPASAQSTDALLADVEDNLIRTVLA